MKNKLILSIGFILLTQGVKAQTGGPGQPEFMQFQQAGTSNLVNPASGTFSYQIPLFTIGGYPMNLTYQSGIQMEDVSSMVGLGWNLNSGSIVRTLRGLPDDFRGDSIIKEFSVKPNETFGGKVGVDLELAGLPENSSGTVSMGLSLSAGLGVFYNNYKGWGLEPSIGGSISGNASKSKEGSSASASLGMGISVNSQSGVDKYCSPSVGFKLGDGDDKMAINFGKTWSVNSNEGLKSSLNMSMSLVRSQSGTRKGVEKGKTHEKGGDQSSLSLLGLSNCSYLNNSFQPDIEYPFENHSGTYSGTLGFDGFYVDPSFRVTGYFSKQTLQTKIQYFLAYGCMNETSDITGKSLMDFNTEKKLPYFIGESKILPIPYKTPDVFNLNGQGLSMTFSVMKNDIGIVCDAEGNVTSDGTQAGAEVNLGQLVKAGANFGTNTSNQRTGIWIPNNFSNANAYFNFKPNQEVAGNTRYEPFYLKNHGEINKFDHSKFSLLGNYEPINFSVIDEKRITSIMSNGSTINLPVYNSNQAVRQSTINYLTAAEAANIGFDKEIKYYNFINTGLGSLVRTAGYRKEHHLSEISVTQPDGMKYVFGIPVYNTTQKEVSFNVSGNTPIDMAKNLIHYNAGSDNSTGNTKGLDNFYESTTTSAYVTQFLITAVLSPDYRDMTNDGITDDDLGNYVKFSYYKENNDYKWRTPFAEDMATYNKGLRSDDRDDKGTYVYGEKELWYVYSIQSKTEIAEFNYSQREDGYGVKDENGGFNSNSFLRKLDYIVIYSLPDRIKNGNNATPIKTIHFSQNYSLCENIDNRSVANTEKGKLTLTSVAFTYENSKKGKLTPYIFSYGKKSPTETINPDYNIRSVNRWGYFQENGNSFSDWMNTSPLSNIDFPYTLQEKVAMDNNAYAWNLTDITIPGGGKLKVNYEAHDYAYIQDKTAGQMFKITGLSSASGETPDNTLYGNSVKNRVFFKLTQPNTVVTKEQLEEKYIKDIKDKYLYYKIYVKLCDPLLCGTDNYDYVTGYAKVKDYGISQDNVYGYIDLETASIDDGNDLVQCNPMLKTTLQFMRISRNELVFNNTTMGTPAGFMSFINSLPSITAQLASQIAASTMGVNLYCKSVLNHAQYIDLDKSFIRLYTPTKSKIAGGSRVKQVSIDDNWSAMTGNTHEDKSYTTSYEYTTQEINQDNETMIISSGVADYEPMVGGDEISLKQPIFYSDTKRMAPDNDYFVEDPVNESLFPAPQITYSKVTQITNETDKVVGKTGKIINEFFTAKDFPVKINRTEISQARHMTKPDPVQPPFVALTELTDFATVAQGYVIELNNMSGLPKATWVYNQNGDRISGEVSEYFPNNDNITTINSKGFINRNTKLGLTVEYTINAKKSYDKSVTTTYNANFNGTYFGVTLIPIIMPLYSKITEEKQFQSIVTNKVIHRNGILKKKTVYEQSSCVATENLAFDEVTGEALLTKMANEFNDTLYSFKYPAWWMYEGMGPSYVNTKLILSSSPLDLVAIKPFLKVGDELRSTGAGPRLWVKSTSGTYPTFINDFGATGFNVNEEYQVYNSAAKNLLSASAGQIVTWNLNPLTGNSKINFGNVNTLNSSAVEYCDSAVMYCDSCDILANRFGKNDYLSGKKGNYRPKKTWFYLTDRTPDDLTSSNTNIKIQGLFKTYTDFWNEPVNPSANWTIGYPNWEWKERVNLTDIDGQTIETEDRIGRKSANLLGYKNTLITAQANNAAYGEMYFEGFEDYYMAYCPYVNTDPAVVNNNKFKRMKVVLGSLIISNSESHTGKYSLEVPLDFGFTILPPKDCNGIAIGTQLNDSIVVANSTTYQNSAPVVIPNSTVPKSRSYQTRTFSQIDTICTSCVGGFFPEKDTKYIFSCWVKVNKPQPILSCSDASVIITCPGSPMVTLHPEGPVIEGWQRVMGTFSTSSGYNNVGVKLVKGVATTFFDDLRIFPADGNMVSYVYDDVNLRLTYSLDENNYFTKNEYNNQGELIRIKKETEKGIITIKEGFSSLLKLHNFNGTK